MKLFGYLDYDESRKAAVILELKKQCKKGVTISELNRRLEKKDGVTWLDENVKEVDTVDKAKYMLLDTGAPSLMKDYDGNVHVYIFKKGMQWTGGYVNSREECIKIMREVEASRATKFELSNKIAISVKEAVESGATPEQVNEVVNKIKEDSSSTNSVKDSVVQSIMKVILDLGDGWDELSLKSILSARLQMARCELNEGRTGNWLKVNSNGGTVLVNTGFMGDDCNWIYVLADVGDNCRLSNIRVLDTKYCLPKLGFDSTDLPTGWIGEDDVFDISLDRFEFDNRYKLNHCITERSYRGSEELNKLSYREMRDRIKLSIEMSVELEKKGILMFEPTYYMSKRKIQLCAPFYARADMKIDEPDGVMLINSDDIYSVNTIIDLNTAYYDVLTVDRNPRAPWLRKMKAIDILSRGVGLGDGFVDDEEQ